MPLQVMPPFNGHTPTYTNLTKVFVPHNYTCIKYVIYRQINKSEAMMGIEILKYREFSTFNEVVIY